MRTTLTLDDDIADFLKRQARLLNKPFKEVVNETCAAACRPLSGSVQGPNTESSQIAAGSPPE